MRDFGAIVGFVPPDIRELFDAQLEPTQEGLAFHTGEWRHGEELAAYSLDPEVQGFMPLVKLAARMGELTLGSDEYLHASITQGMAPDILAHDKLPAAAVGSSFDQVLISDRLGIRYIRKGGRTVPALDFSLLLLPKTSERATQRPKVGSKNTLIQVSVLPTRVIDLTEAAPDPVSYSSAS